MRSPRRTAQTSSALMVGLALVSTIAVFGASLSKSATSSVDNAVSADYIITSSAQAAPEGFSNSVADRRGQGPGCHGRLDRLQRASSSSGSRCPPSPPSPPTTCPRRSSCAWTAGQGAAALAAGELLIDTTTANNKHLSVGSVVPVKFAQTGTSTMRIGGIFKPNALLGSYLVGDSFFLAHFNNPLPGGRAPADRRRQHGHRQRRSTRGLRAYPNLKIQTRAQFEKSQQSRSTSCSAWSTPCWPWPWSSPSSASSTP